MFRNSIFELKVLYTAFPKHCHCYRLLVLICFDVTRSPQAIVATLVRIPMDQKNKQDSSAGTIETCCVVRDCKTAVIFHVVLTSTLNTLHRHHLLFQLFFKKRKHICSGVHSIYLGRGGGLLLSYEHDTLTVYRFVLSFGSKRNICCFMLG